jgi:hypothetical protein
MLITIYARKEPTTDIVALAADIKGKKDVVFYKDEACTVPFCRWSWHLNPPRRNWKRVTLNCWRWAIKWLPDTAPESAGVQVA